MKTLSILCWKWRGPSGFRSEYTAEHVNILFAMLKRHLTIPFRLFCVTDDAAGISEDVIPWPIWDKPVVKVDPKKPNCYRRLRMYSREAREWWGDRILSIDLDCVIASNIDTIVSRDVDFCAWYKRGVPYQGGLVLHRTGTRPQLWEQFDPIKSPALGRSRGYCGSDQAWVSAKLPHGEAVWTPESHGILSFKAHLRNDPHYKATGLLPKGTTIVFFHGTPKPFDPGMDQHAFIREHYRQ